MKTSPLRFVAVAAVLIAGSTALAAPAPEVLYPVEGAAWGTETHPDFAAFDAWVTDFARGGASTKSVATGVRLAARRRVALLKLMRTEPARALASSVPRAVRASLPAEVLPDVETPFSAVGDYAEICELRAIGGPAVPPSRQEITIEGKVYRAHVYGRRVGLASRRHLFLHGILLGNEAVLNENVLRAVPPEESALGKRAPRDLSAGAQPLLAEAGDGLYRFGSAADRRQAEEKLRALETHRAPENAEFSERSALEDPSFVVPAPDSAYTTGAKKVLIIVVDFADLPGNPVDFSATHTPASMLNLLNTQIDAFYQRSSYGQTSLAGTVNTQLYRMPRTAASYAQAGDNGALHSDARAAAAADYSLTNFDRICVVFSYLGGLPNSLITYGGLAQVGGRNLWVNGEFDFRVVAHELGHTYGLLHGNLWQVFDGNPISEAGSSAEYKDDFDTMGANFANSQATDFNVWYKNQLGWAPDAKVQTVTSSGTYRISRFDGASDAGALALKIAKDSTRNYWIGARRNFTDNNSMSHGVYVGWGYNSNGLPHNVLDLQTPGASVSDAALPTGSTFIDADAHLSIKPVVEGFTSPNAYEDVQIDLDATLQAPVITSASVASATVDQFFTYQITATNSPTLYGASDLHGPSLDYGPTTGQIAGTPKVAGSYLISLSATNSAGTGEATLTVNVAAAPSGPPVINSPLTASAVVGQPFSYQITATRPASDFLAYPLPDGLSVNQQSGLLSGTPTLAGKYAITILAGSSSGDGSATLTLTVSASASGAANDDFAKAAVLTGLSGTTAGTNTGATKERGEPNHAGKPGGASVWYRWTAPAGGPVTFDTLGSGFDTLLGVYTGVNVNQLAAVAADDDYPPNYGLLSRVDFIARRG